MPRVLKQGQCVVCGKVYILQERRYRPTCSYSCGFKRMKGSIQQMRDKEGHLYNRWKEHMEAYKSKKLD